MVSSTIHIFYFPFNECGVCQMEADKYMKRKQKEEKDA